MGPGDDVMMSLMIFSFRYFPSSVKSMCLNTPLIMHYANISGWCVILIFLE